MAASGQLNHPKMINRGGNNDGFQSCARSTAAATLAEVRADARGATEHAQTEQS
jgi:hypothetical protein